MTFDDLITAREVFNLPDRATLREIKSRHRELVKRFHPDTGCPACEGDMIRVNAAYAVLLGYVSSYRFSFSENEFYEQNPDEQLRRQFSDPLWGKP